MSYHGSHPFLHTQPHTLSEGHTEGAVAVVATLHSQILCGGRMTVIHGLLVALGEVVDAQVVDVGIVIDALAREIQNEIGAVAKKYNEL